MPAVRSSHLVAPFADRLLAADVPALGVVQRAEVVAFVGRRVDGLPGFIRLGVTGVAAVFRVLLPLPGGWRIVSALSRRPLPLLGEYPRLVRSLAYAYIWERWPQTPTGRGGA
ncbi:MAG: hypothetical protein JWM12_2175 [Ilumatobacteraceae bacterium]|nr:hypothetical protein [Ilumatobacteraceae bacterium]